MNRLAKGVIGGAMLMLSVSAWAAHHETANEALAKAWVTALDTGKSEAIAMVKQNMAEDGVAKTGRYVGFGFILDPQNDEELVVASVMPGSPASAVLNVGDVFVSVNDVPATRENRDRMSFRGKPGEPVKAVIKRGGKTMPIEVKRGIIDNANSKAQVLENMGRGDADTWPVSESKIVEVMSKGNVVYVVRNIKDVDDDSGLSFENRIITRFEFNDAGQVAHASGMGESQFVLEQTGYTISR